jgi:O-antigen ligase
MNGTSAIGKTRVDTILTDRAFKLLLVYLFFEYGRPQSLVPVLGKLHLPGVIIVILMFSLVQSGGIDFANPFSKLFFVLLGIMTLHGPFATNNYWALMMWKSTLLYFIVFLSMSRFVNSMDRFNRMMRVWIAVHLILAVVGIIKGGRGIGGFLEDENDLCMTINMIIPYSFFLAMAAKEKKKKIYLFLLTGVFIFTNIVTFSRGGFIGLMGVGAYIWFRSPRKMVTTFLIVILATFVVLSAPKKYWGEVRSITEEGTKKGSGEERIYTWKIGWEMFLDNPLFGVGQGNFPWDFRQYELESGHEEGLHTRSIAGRAAHSLYFQLLPELGLTGGVIFFLLLINFLRCIRNIRSAGKRGDPHKKLEAPYKDYFYLSYAMEGSLVGYLVSGLFISIFYYPNFWLLISFAYTINLIVNKKNEILDTSQPGLAPLT